MPIFAGLLITLANFFASVFSRFLGIEAAIKLAAYLAWMALLGAMLLSVFVCLTSLYNMASGLFGGGGGGGFLGWFFMGLGIFIPANAGGVMSCVAGVWLATNIYRVQSFAIKTFHGGGALVP
jgi:hypothetical protein